MSIAGYELRKTFTGDGVFATRDFDAGETVMVCVVARRVDRNDAWANQVSRNDWVRERGLAPKLNHSCEPNCGVRCNAAGDVELVARAPIAAGEEITFDYAMRNYVIDHFPARCRCGTSACRGTITGWKDLPAERRAAYGELVAPYLREIERDTEPAAPPAPTPRSHRRGSSHGG